MRTLTQKSLSATSLLLSILLCGISSPKAVAEETSREDMTQAISKLQKKELEKAYETLDTVPQDSLSFRIAFLEMQKVHYRQQSWDKFFGYATYYRKKLLGTFFQPELLVLEALALVKHCQFEVASNFVFASQQIVSELKEGDASQNATAKALYHRELKKLAGDVRSWDQLLARAEGQLNTVENLLLLQTKIPGKIKSDPVHKKSRVFAKDVFWNVEHEDSKINMVEKAVRHPRALRVYVKNMCGKEGEVQ